jgi:hypothetical protein
VSRIHAVTEELAERAPLNTRRSCDPHGDGRLLELRSMPLEKSVQASGTAAEATSEIVVDGAMAATDRGLVQDTERRVVLDEVPVLIAGKATEPRQLRGAIAGRTDEADRRSVRKRAMKSDLGS